MPRKATGSIATRENKDGTVSHDLRFRAYGERQTVTVRGSRSAAEAELELILARVKAGVWRREDHDGPIAAPPTEEPTLHQLASECMAEWEPDLKPRAYDDYMWLLRKHLLPFFAEYRPS
jgi:hypothetical protein